MPGLLLALPLFFNLLFPLRILLAVVELQSGSEVVVIVFFENEVPHFCVDDVVFFEVFKQRFSGCQVVLREGAFLFDRDAPSLFDNNSLGPMLGPEALGLQRVALLID